MKGGPLELHAAFPFSRAGANPHSKEGDVRIVYCLEEGPGVWRCGLLAKDSRQPNNSDSVNMSLQLMTKVSNQAKGSISHSRHFTST